MIRDSISKVRHCAGSTAQFTSLHSAFYDISEIDSLTKRCKASENAFLSVYKLLADAPDPYPLLEAAVVSSRHIQSYLGPSSESFLPQDQTVKVAEAEALEAEIQKLRDENSELRRRAAEASTLEGSLKKAETKVGTLEEKVKNGPSAALRSLFIICTDGDPHTRAGYTKRKRAQCDI